MRDYTTMSIPVDVDPGMMLPVTMATPEFGGDVMEIL